MEEETDEMIDSSTANIKEEDPLTRYGKRESDGPKKKRKKRRPHIFPVVGSSVAEP
jgi:hypothetical protein